MIEKLLTELLGFLLLVLLSMTIAELEEKVQSLTEQQKQAEINYHQVTGALAVSQQLLEEAKAKESGKKEEKKK
jgi:hypothetical protein